MAAYGGHVVRLVNRFICIFYFHHGRAFRRPTTLIQFNMPVHPIKVGVPAGRGALLNVDTRYKIQETKIQDIKDTMFNKTMFNKKTCDFCSHASLITELIESPKTGERKILCWDCWIRFGRPQDIQKLFEFLKGKPALLAALRTKWAGASPNDPSEENKK
jgi:hypothetical protein